MEVVVAVVRTSGGLWTGDRHLSSVCGGMFEQI